MSDALNLPAFSLIDSRGGSRHFPTGHPTLLCFVKEDCPTCGLSMPLIEEVHRALGSAVEVWTIGQEREGNAILEKRHGLTLPMLDDSALRVSFSYQIEIVPTLIASDAEGRVLHRFEGFSRKEWRSAVEKLAEMVGMAAPDLQWERYPELRVGCGSKSVEPGIAERLA